MGLWPSGLPGGEIKRKQDGDEDDFCSIVQRGQPTLRFKLVLTNSHKKSPKKGLFYFRVKDGARTRDP
ncbi:MAG TPA: hypothetical protein DIW27_08340, partial [Cytophagales bacterium]|nr:hypothetical protein [Cytophagales bacterium]